MPPKTKPLTTKERKELADEVERRAAIQKAINKKAREIRSEKRTRKVSEPSSPQQTSTESQPPHSETLVHDVSDFSLSTQQSTSLSLSSNPDSSPQRDESSVELEVFLDDTVIEKTPHNSPAKLRRSQSAEEVPTSHHSDRLSSSESGSDNFFSDFEYEDTDDEMTKEEDDRKKALEVFASRRTILHHRYEKIRAVIAGHPTVPISKARLGIESENLNKVEEIFQELSMNTQLILVDTDDPTHADALDDFDTEITALKCEIAEIRAALTTPTGTHSTTNALKIKAIEIPKFDGSDRTKWQSFKELFKVIYHDNKGLQDVQRMSQLLSSLEGKAFDTVAKYPLTAAGYKEAMLALEEKYDRKRENVNAHLNKFMEIPAMHHESGSGLETIVDGTNLLLRSLKTLAIDTDKWDAILIFLIEKKLDKTTIKEWELSLGDDSRVQKLSKFLSFLTGRSHALSSSLLQKSSNESKSNSSGKKDQKGQRGSSSKPSTHHTASESQSAESSTDSATTSSSNSNSNVFYTLKNMKSVNERYKFLKSNPQLCKNCLREHNISDCRSRHCKECDEKHHTLLHREKKSQSTPQSQQSSSSSPATTTTTTAEAVEPVHHSSFGHGTHVLLATAVVQLQDSCGQFHSVRALLDSGSTVNILSERTVQRLGLKCESSSTQINGPAAVNVGTSKGRVSTIIKSITDPSWKHPIEMLVLPKVTSDLPTRQCNPETWTHLNDIKLADPTFFKPGPIDLLIGVEIYNEIFQTRKYRGPPGTPTAHLTKFGYVLMGATAPATSQATVHIATLSDETFDLTNFWKMEEVSSVKPRTIEEKACEAHFAATHTRKPNGQFEVMLPFKSTTTSLGESKGQAMRRLKSQEKTRQSRPEIDHLYTEFMEEYESLNHMEKVPLNELGKPAGQVYYLPHHPVLKDSSPTKLRVVFDASAKTSTGISLNNLLMVGPTIQDDLVSIVIRFRTHKVAMTADISKMYRRILVHPSQRDFQRILWRKSPSDPIEEYRLCSLTYGTASASYLAIKSVQQLAQDESSKFPLACQVILEDYYVDDLLTGGESIAAALQLQSQLLSVMDSGQFQLRKWNSNKPQLLESLSPDLRDTQLSILLDSKDKTKALGISWSPSSDKFGFVIKIQENIKPTKRNVLSCIARIFDPIGWIAPVIIQAKILMQLIWTTNLDWDDHLPPQLAQQWNSYTESLSSIAKIEIDRCVLPLHNYSDLQLHGFSDASEKAYSAVVYLRGKTSDNQFSSKLIVSKTRVAPIKKLSIARLELCAAKLLSDLMEVAISALKLPINGVHYWSDSTTTLHWINAPCTRWQIFVGNRVSHIQERSSPSQWHHVKGSENPADCASRGITPQELITHQLWWNGPPWLRSNNLPIGPIPGGGKEAEQDIRKEEKKVVAVHTIDTSNSLLHKYSNWTKLKRVTSYVFRFISNARIPSDRKEERIHGPLTLSELNNSEAHWIKKTQEEEFSHELSHVKMEKEWPKSSSIISLNPQLKDGIIRVGGRCENSMWTPDQKHPIIIPRKSHLASLLIDHFHLKLLHAGPQLVLATLQQRYWIINGRSSVRNYVRKCVICSRFRAQPTTQLMGNLPSSRCNPTRAFQSTGVDYAGPFILRPEFKSKGRKAGPQNYKAWICLFVCMSTKAIHLELVTTLTPEGFIGCLKRFVSRRGSPVQLHSDNGTNFTRADKDLKEFYKSAIEQKPEIAEFLANQGIEWSFNPPIAPHHGGLWEAAVKSVKHHIRRVIGEQELTYEEFTTFLNQVEACVNSRPLTPMSTDPNDLRVLTPGHFLIGKPITAVPEPDYSDIKENRLSRYQFIQRLEQQFWKRWSNEYLTQLQQRRKWLTRKKNLEIGQLVLLKEDNVPATQWHRARIIAVHPGSDGAVRVVTVKTKGIYKDSCRTDTNGDLTFSVYKRPITMVVPLPLDEADGKNETQT